MPDDDARMRGSTRASRGGDVLANTPMNLGNPERLPPVTTRVSYVVTTFRRSRGFAVINPGS